MGLKSTFKRFFDLDEEVGETRQVNEKVEEPVQAPTRTARSVPVRTAASGQQNVVHLKSVPTPQATRMILVEPAKYEDVLTIAEHLQNRKAVVFNVQRLTREEAMRVVDFISGAIHIMNGSIKKVSSNAFLCALDNIDISGDILEEFDSTY
ncbi:MAG TPA: cell division protein SepF [Sporolactobacillaceae bacterium]|nr:cell division protein SepF [Sporolactobacillaceae bacterium]